MKILQILFVFWICLLSVLDISATDNSFKLDFDGDGRTDLALYREGSRSLDVAPQPSMWYFLSTRTSASSVVQWGRTLDVPAPADFNGDGKTDVAVYRWWNFDTGDTNEWWVDSGAGNYNVLTVYEPGYYKFNRNYVGDARAEIGQLYQINISQIPNQPCYISIYFVGDLQQNTLRKTVGEACNVIPTPIPGDYNNDGRSEIAVYNNQTFKVWLPPYDSSYTPPDMTQTLNVDAPAPGDYDGDGKTDFAGTRNQNGRLIWVIKNSSNGSVTETDFGFATDKPVPGDYDGDGKTDIAVYRPETSTWWIINSQLGLSSWYFGLPTDTPLAMPVIPFDPSP